MKRHRTALKLAAIFLSLAFIYFVIVPTYGIWSVRWTIGKALKIADSVRLEEYSWNAFTNHVLSSAELQPAQREEILQAMPLHIQLGFPGMVARCFYPHHRVIVATKGQDDLTLQICFGCEQIKLKGQSIQPTPAQWSKNFRLLLQKFKVDVKDESAYGKIDSDFLKQDTEQDMPATK